MDWPADPATYAVDDQFMFGPSMLVAPMIAGQGKRPVYLPAGKWYDFWTGKEFEGGRTIQVTKAFDEVPVFVKENTLLPLAAPLQHVTRDSVFDLTVRAYGRNPKPFVLFEDDGESDDYLKGKQSRLTQSWDKEGGHIERSGAHAGPPRFKVTQWTPVEASTAEAGSKVLRNGDFSANASDFSVVGATGYISQCKPIENWRASDPNSIGLQPLENEFSNMGPNSHAGVSYYAFLQRSGNQISQPLKLPPGVSYTLSFQYAARDHADDTSPTEQVLKVNVVGSGSPVVTKNLIGSKSGFVTATLEFTDFRGGTKSRTFCTKCHCRKSALRINKLQSALGRIELRNPK